MVQQFRRGLDKTWKANPIPVIWRSHYQNIPMLEISEKFGGWRKALEKFIEHINKEDIPTTKSLSSKISNYKNT